MKMLIQKIIFLLMCFKLFDYTQQTDVNSKFFEKIKFKKSF